MKYLFFLLLPFTLSAQPKAVASVKVTGTTATLTASQSSGNIGSYYWVATPSVSFTNGVYYGGSNLSDITATIKPGIKYSFILTVQDKGGAVGTASCIYDPAAVIVVTPPPVVVKRDTIQYSESIIGQWAYRWIIWSDSTQEISKIKR